MTRPRRRTRALERPTARPPTIAAVVASPYTPGTVDRVRRVVDTLLQLHRSRQINDAQYAAADRYRTAYEAVRAGMGGAGDYERARGGAPGSRSITPAAARGADDLADASKALRACGAEVLVEMIVGQGWTAEQAARAIFARATRRDREHVTAFLRAGLSALVELWGQDAPRRRYGGRG